MIKLSRRDFLTICARASALAFYPGIKSLSIPPAAQSQVPVVSVAEGIDEDSPAQILQTALAGLGGIERFIKPGQTVAIKPNATWAYPPKTASSTDPDFLTAVIQAVQAAGAGRIIVMDHCSIEPGADEALRINGIGQLVKDLGIEHVFPDRFNAPASTYTKIELPHGQTNQSIGVIKAAVEADVRINLAVAKTHNVTKFTMCLKHMMGFLQQPGLLHTNLEQGIADISTSSAIQAQLHILEAIRVRIPYGMYPTCAGPETDITNPQVVTRRNTVIAGIDPVLIDAYGCINFFDIQPQELTHLLRAYESGCGDLDVEVALADGRIRHVKVGETIQENPTVADETSSATPALLTPKPTAIILPPSGSVDSSVASSTLGGTNCSPYDQVISPSPLLNKALIPAAVILSGLGLAILSRMRRRLPKDPPTTEQQLTQKDDSNTEERHG
jgi:uncharacterized protein (DUF362 family)